MRKEIELLGDLIHSEEDFHREIGQLLSFPSYYRHDIDALYEFLTAYADKNLTINWLNHRASQQSMGNDFERILETIRAVESTVSEFRLMLN